MGGAESLKSALDAELEAIKGRRVRERPAQGPYLCESEKGLVLCMPSGLSIGIDFHRAQYNRKFKPSQDLLCRACGWHLGYRSVWDLTAGLGVDAVLLARAGFRVRAIEANAYLAFLLRWAHLRGPQALLRSLVFEWADSERRIRLAESAAEKRPEVLYYDPMYPATRKTALPSKEMQVLRELHGASGERDSLFRAAMRFGCKRLVVKRPLRAPPLQEGPQGSIQGKLVRYDIYSPFS